MDWWNAPSLRAAWRPEEAWNTFLTSSVISVAMDLPISWYWGPLPEGPRRMKRNLEAKIIRTKHSDNLCSPINQSCHKCFSIHFIYVAFWSRSKVNQDWRVRVPHMKYFRFFKWNRHYYYVITIPHTWWRWGPLPDHWEEPPATDGQTPPQACSGSPALPLRRCTPQPQLGSFSWSEDLSGSQVLIV